jgi:hypothetical protein
MRSFFVVFLGFLSFIYLLNPTFGVFEILPDAIPGIGNIDEALATGVFLSALAYFGIDLPIFFGKKNEKRDTSVIRDAQIDDISKN